ncbi:MAG: TerC family protein [Caldilineaceae bacterium]|nr:TerC family protein [Caldilineaceae bacterium]
MATNIWFWVIFNAFVLGMLILDLGVFHRHAHAVTVKEAAIWSVVWISLALLFNYGLYLFEGSTIALEFLGGYLLEKSLSVDNIFVFVLVFSYFRVPPTYQHRVLFWGILTALILRGVMIIAGAALVTRFEFLIAIFGAFLVFTAIRMAKDDGEELDMENNVLVRMLRRLMPVSSRYHDDHFFTVQNGVRMATPLLVVLLVIESSDVIFAIDSIPAVFGITKDPFIVYTSNIFAILGLRSLYFLLAGVIDRFEYLKLGLSIVLGFVGVKMLTESISGYVMAHPIHVPIHWSLGFIAAVLLASVGASLILSRPQDEVVQVEQTEEGLLLSRTDASD